jgi:hypothetical protein
MGLVFAIRHSGSSASSGLKASRRICSAVAAVYDRRAQFHALLHFVGGSFDKLRTGGDRRHRLSQPKDQDDRDG